MSAKWILATFAVFACVGLGTSLRCFLCTYQKAVGEEIAGSSEGCKGEDFDMNTVDMECTNAGDSCFTQYTKTSDDTYGWTRGCQASCTNSSTTSGWIKCCDSADLCNNAGDDDDDDDDDSKESEEEDLEKCYSCTYSEEDGQAVTGGGATNNAACKRDDVTSDRTVTDVACTTACFTEKMMMDNNVTMWERGCRENCTALKPETAKGNYTLCCTNNLCNGNVNQLTSGCDVINHMTSSLLAATVLAVIGAWWKI